MTTKNDIETALWRICTSFRGKIHSGKYKDYVLAMLFIKYLSDSYEEANELKMINVDKNSTLNYLLDINEYTVPDNAKFEYLFNNRKNPNIGLMINEAKTILEEYNKEKLNNIFSDLDFNSSDLGNGLDKIGTLSTLLEGFYDLNLKPKQLENNDIIGDAYMYLLDKFASEFGKKGGEFYTPIEVSEILAKIVKPNENETIYDPTCGSGSLLITAYYQSKDRKKVKIFGQERNYQTWTMCRMNMYLHQITDATIWLGDTITTPKNIIESKNELQKFDCIVANPPFSLDKWTIGFDLDKNNTKEFKFKNEMDLYNRFDWGVPPKSKGDYAFILHMLNSLNENGRLAVVMPHGVLFRGGAEGEIRQKIVENNLLDAVIGLPVNLFYGTSIPTCILVINKNRKNDNVLFIDASKEFGVEKKQNKLTTKNVEKIVSTYNNRKKIKKYSNLVTLKEIRKNDYNLNIPRYVDTFEKEEEVDVVTLLKEIKKLELERDNLSQEIEVYLKELGLIDF